MENEIRLIVKNQVLASLATLNQCLENCPDAEWDAVHGDAPFSQALFHTLFFTDYYFSRNEGDFKNQPFHREHKEIFRDYEELADKIPEYLYTREEIQGYLQFCREKTETIFDPSKQTNMFSISEQREMTMLELYIYVTRHIQHHAAQLGLRLQQITGKALGWVGSGWREQAKAGQ